MQIKTFFGDIGSIFEDKTSNTVCYRIFKLIDLIKVIIPHFDKYVLITQKQGDFLI
jgi:hypothetical protein